jgi:hypothetical protein
MSRSTVGSVIYPIVVGLLVGVAASVAGGQPKSSSGARTTNFVLIGWAGGDHFYNYDNLAQSAAGNNVDWPVTKTFVNNAWVGGVKVLMDNGGSSPDVHFAGNTMNLRSKGNAALVWEKRQRRKGSVRKLPREHSMKIFAAPADDENWNPVDGFWLGGTTHWDNGENCAGANFGWSEDASEVPG